MRQITQILPLVYSNRQFECIEFVSVFSLTAVRFDQLVHQHDPFDLFWKLFFVRSDLCQFVLHKQHDKSLVHLSIIPHFFLELYYFSLHGGAFTLNIILLYT